jgi:uncharacterized RDD family membrane protein YckC
MARKARDVDRQMEARDVTVGLALVCGRVGATAGRLVLLPFRVAVRSPVLGPVLGRTGESLAEEGRGARVRGSDQLEAAASKVLASPEVERAVDHALAGPLPEAVARSAVDHRVAQRVVEQVLATTDLEAAVAASLEHETTKRLVEETLASPGFERLLASALASELTERVVQSAETQRLVEEIASSPAVRAALARQTMTLGDEVAAGLRRLMERLDDAAERKVRGWLRRRPQQASASVSGAAHGGLGARGVAFAIDLVIAAAVFLMGAALVWLVAALVGGLRPSWLAQTLASAGWAILVGGYLVLFWTVTGQTPGMRVMSLHVADQRGHPPRLGRSLVRLIGVVLAIVPMFAGFLPVLVDDRRRALQDFLAGTVVYTEDGLEPSAALPDSEGRPQAALVDSDVPAATSS